jgi:D-glycero-alpha-D-manno-heptose-7-phosphate kinase
LKISVSSPTRIDLAGGTLDLWPLYNFVGGSVTTNISIDIRTYVDLSPRTDAAIDVHLEDLDYQKTFSNLEQLLNCKDRELSLLQGHVQYWRPRTGFQVICRSESPVGGGLGGSSSLSISLIKAFAKWMEHLMTPMEQVTLASNIEAQVLHTPTGTQDYFPAIRGGLHLLNFDFNGPLEEILDIPLEPLQERMFLVYTGRPHNSGLNNWEVYKAAINKDPIVLKALYDIKVVADQVANACRIQNWSVLGDLFKQEFKARVQLSSGFNSPEIEQLRATVLEAGADALKICGAGGGGCVMIWSVPERKASLMDLCSKMGFQVFNVKPVAM